MGWSQETGANAGEVRDEPARSGCPDTVQSPARFLHGQNTEPSYSNNAMGGSSRKLFIPEDGGPATRLKVAVDIDEVLGHFVQSLNSFCYEKYGLTYDISDYFKWDFAAVWNCSRGVADRRVHDFFESDHFTGGILPIPGAKASLQRLRESYDLEVVTSRQNIVKQLTLDWIEEHFPETFSAVHFGNHWALEGTSRKKSEICREIGATVLIEDNPGYAEDCAQAGIRVLLFDWKLSYPWAKIANGCDHPSICRVEDWDEVEKALGDMARKN